MMEEEGVMTCPGPALEKNELGRPTHHGGEMGENADRERKNEKWALLHALTPNKQSSS